MGHGPTNWIFFKGNLHSTSLSFLFTLESGKLVFHKSEEDKRKDGHLTKRKVPYALRTCFKVVEDSKTAIYCHVYHGPLKQLNGSFRCFHLIIFCLASIWWHISCWTWIEQFRWHSFSKLSLEQITKKATRWRKFWLSMTWYDMWSFMKYLRLLSLRSHSKVYSIACRQIQAILLWKLELNVIAARLLSLASTSYSYFFSRTGFSRLETKCGQLMI